MGNPVAAIQAGVSAEAMEVRVGFVMNLGMRSDSLPLVPGLAVANRCVRLRPCAFRVRSPNAACDVQCRVFKSFARSMSVRSRYLVTRD